MSFTQFNKTNRNVKSKIFPQSFRYNLYFGRFLPDVEYRKCFYSFELYNNTRFNISSERLNLGNLIPFKNSDIVLKKPVNYIKLEEAEAIKRAVDIVYEKTSHTETDTFVRDRDRLLLTLMWTTGARISDVLAMASEKINFKERSITFLVKKRKDKDRTDKAFWHTISIDMETLADLMGYIQTWSIKGLLFPAYRHCTKPMTRQAMNIKLNQFTDLIGMRRINPHQYRHGIAMHLQSKGVYAEMIAFRLAHSSTAVTLSFYARIDAAQERNMLESMNVRLR
jgi:integrase